MTALMWAAWNNHHAIVRALVDARADVNTENNDGCAFPGPSARVGGGRRSPIAPVPAPSGRYTALHHAAMNGHTNVAVPLLIGGADQTMKDTGG